MFRLQSNPQGSGLMSYIAEGHVLDADPCSFGGIGIVGIKGFARFYRHVMLEKQFPHHGAFAFSHIGGILYDAARLLGIGDIGTPKSEGALYCTENPF